MGMRRIKVETVTMECSWGVIPGGDRFGNANHAYSFNGVNGYIEISNGQSFNFQ